nr:protein EDS1 [Tanacetum cinerariifolium]
RKMVSVKNSNAVLQILFFSSQPADEADLKNAASRSLYMAMAYHNELNESLVMQDVVYLEDEIEIPLSSNSSASGDTTFVNIILKDLGLDEDTGTYLRKGGRPKRYKYTQRWREHAQKLEEGTSSETTFWSKVEELKRKTYEKIKEQIIDLEKQVKEWVEKEEVGTDVFLEKSTFVEWWKTISKKHRSKSCLRVHL